MSDEPSMQRDAHPASQPTLEEVTTVHANLGRHILEQLIELQSSVEALHRPRNTAGENKPEPATHEPSTTTFNERDLLVLNIRLANINNGLYNTREDIDRVLNEVRNSKVAIYELWEALWCCMWCNKCCSACRACCDCNTCCSECRETCGVCCKAACSCCI